MYLLGVLVNCILVLITPPPPPHLSGLETRMCNSLGLRMKFKTLFMSDEEKLGHHFDWPLFFNMSKPFLAPGALSAECFQVGVM